MPKIKKITVIRNGSLAEETAFIPHGASIFDFFRDVQTKEVSMNDMHRGFWLSGISWPYILLLIDQIMNRGDGVVLEMTRDDMFPSLASIANKHDRKLHVLCSKDFLGKDQSIQPEKLQSLINKNELVVIFHDFTEEDYASDSIDMENSALDRVLNVLFEQEQHKSDKISWCFMESNHFQVEYIKKYRFRKGYRRIMGVHIEGEGNYPKSLVKNTSSVFSVHMKRKGLVLASRYYDRTDEEDRVFEIEYKEQYKLEQSPYICFLLNPDDYKKGALPDSSSLHIVDAFDLFVDPQSSTEPSNIRFWT